MLTKDRLQLKQTLTVGVSTWTYYSLSKLQEEAFPEVAQLPFSLKVLLENVMRYEDGKRVTGDDIQAIATWTASRTRGKEIAYRPARVLMQDFTGVPAVVDLAAMRDAMIKMGGKAEQINPLRNVDLVIDHSVMVDAFGNEKAFSENKDLEYARNGERYRFLKWGQKAFQNFRVVPPGTGICHQVNLEYLAQVVWTEEKDGQKWAYPDTLVGTDSHTTMVNALAVLGWGVGGIEAEAVMLDQPISMLIPEVIGFKLEGALKEGTTATDLVLTITQMLREKGVVGKFVEFYGPGLDQLPLADRSTISNMAPEYGATCGFFPIDNETLNYLRLSGRDGGHIEFVEAYAKAQGMWRDAHTPDPLFTDSLYLDMNTIEPCLAGPKRPQDRVLLGQVPGNFDTLLKEEGGKRTGDASASDKDAPHALTHGDVVIAAITSCTNTSNPSVMIGAGLLARNAVKKGLRVKPWVKTSLAPGSQVVTDYLAAAGLDKDLDALGFNLVGYGCTTCIGNSGPLSASIQSAIEEGDLSVASVLSGNRNFEGRVNPHVKANYLASPPLVIAYALLGTVTEDIQTTPLGEDGEGNPIYLKDIWPHSSEIQDCVHASVTPEMFKQRYAKVFAGDEEWEVLSVNDDPVFEWDAASTYIQNPPYFAKMDQQDGLSQDIVGARPLAIFGDSVTTDHISPAGAIKGDSPAGLYLQSKGVAPKDFNSYGARRGNHEVMMRGTFANIRIKNEMVPGVTGGYTLLMPDGAQMPIYDAAMAYAEADVPLVVVAGKEYGTGSSRDWAAKGTQLLGVKAVIAESFERIHRSNLIGMGVLPLVFDAGETRESLNINKDTRLSILGIETLAPQQTLTLRIENDQTNTVKETKVLCRIDTADELRYYRNNGILPYVLRQLHAA